MIVVVSLLLGAVFVVSGILKVAAPRDWLAESAALGVPHAVAVVVPVVELLIGALLIAQLARRLAAVGAALLLLAFTALLVVRLRQGRRPPCACFGALSAKPIGWGNVVRNAVFLALALVLVVQGG